MAKKSKVTKAPKHRVNVEKKKTLRSFSRSKITVTMTAGEAEAVPATGYNFNPDKVPLRPGKPRIILPEQRIAELKAITGNPISTTVFLKDPSSGQRSVLTEFTCMCFIGHGVFFNKPVEQLTGNIMR